MWSLFYLQWFKPIEWVNRTLTFLDRWIEPSLFVHENFLYNTESKIIIIYNSYQMCWENWTWSTPMLKKNCWSKKEQFPMNSVREIRWQCVQNIKLYSANIECSDSELPVITFTFVDEQEFVWLITWWIHS